MKYLLLIVLLVTSVQAYYADHDTMYATMSYQATVFTRTRSEAGEISIKIDRTKLYYLKFITYLEEDQSRIIRMIDYNLAGGSGLEFLIFRCPSETIYEWPLMAPENPNPARMMDGNILSIEFKESIKTDVFLVLGQYVRVYQHIYQPGDPYRHGKVLIQMHVTEVKKGEIDIIAYYDSIVAYEDSIATYEDSISEAYQDSLQAYQDSVLVAMWDSIRAHADSVAKADSLLAYIDSVAKTDSLLAYIDSVAKADSLSTPILFIKEPEGMSLLKPYYDVLGRFIYNRKGRIRKMRR